jgi:hypothetical protein
MTQVSQLDQQYPPGILDSIISPLDERQSAENEIQNDYSWDLFLMTIMSLAGLGVHVMYWLKFAGSTTLSTSITSVLISGVAEIAAWAMVFRFARAFYKEAWKKGRIMGSILSILIYLAIAGIYCGFAILGAEFVAKEKSEKPAERLENADKSDNIIALQDREIATEEEKHTTTVQSIKTSYANKHRATNGASWVNAERDKKLDKENSRHSNKMEQLTERHSSAYTTAITARDSSTSALTQLYMFEKIRYFNDVDSKAGWIKYLTLITFAIFTLSGINAYKGRRSGVAQKVDPALRKFPTALHYLMGSLAVAASFPMMLVGNLLRYLDLEPKLAVAAVGGVAHQPQRAQRPQRANTTIEPQAQRTATTPQAQSMAHNVAEPQAQPMAHNVAEPQPQPVAHNVAEPQPRTAGTEPIEFELTTLRAQPQPTQVIVNNPTILAGPRSSRDQSEQAIIRRYLDERGYAGTASKEVMDMIKAAKNNYNRIPDGRNEALYAEKSAYLRQHGIEMVNGVAIPIVHAN